MDFLGPIGLTIATTWILEKCARLIRVWREAWRTGFDYRLVFLGAVLPDLIDKPLGFWIAPDIVNNSLRSVGHSVLFMVVAAVVVWVVTRRHGPSPAAGFVMALVAHLAFDQMWQMPRALFWPFLGWSFPEGTVPLSWWVHVHFTHPQARPLDLIGSAVLLFVAIRFLASSARRFFWQPPEVAR